MSILLASMVLPLFAVQADDPKLLSKRTFVSETARASLSEGNSEDILCLKRRGNPKKKTICLVKSQWKKAVQIANSQPPEGPRPYIPDGFHIPLSKKVTVVFSEYNF